VSTGGELADGTRGAEPSMLNWDEEWRSGGIFDILPDAIVAVASDGTIVRVNTQLATMFGYAAFELVGSPIEVLLPHRARARHVRHRESYQADPHVRAMSKREDLLGRRKDGSEFPVDIMLGPVSSLADQQVIAVIRDVSAAKEAAFRLNQLAYADQLTGLPNRAALYRDLGESLRQLGTVGVAAITVALFDLDGFKDVNDTMGHSIGDTLLRLVTGRWASVIPEWARLYRLGGDEFVVVAPASGDPLQMVALVREMIDEIAKPFEVRNEPIFIGTSVGIAIGPEAGTNIEELLASADLALYRAKGGRRGTYAFYLPVMRAEAQARRSLVGEIEQAHSAGELELYFQPQVRLSDLKFSGAEALMRWRHPAQGILPPAVFIAALAASPIASEVGRWALRTVCLQASAWRKEGMPDLTIGVNLFQAQIRDKNLPDEVEAALTEAGLPARLLELEISENFALDGDETTIRSLSRLRQSGVQLALDDLGTGQASLHYLTVLPVSRVKIDQTFVRGMISRNKEAVVVRMIVAMAHGLGLQVIAEGVEIARQVEILTAAKCDHVQGYLFGHPLPAREFKELVLAGGAIRRALTVGGG
jgi:diguanylate cyclase (GGDEF)-like protein/PAS domain S-box-containing protein